MAKYSSESGLSFEIIPRDINFDMSVTTVYFRILLEIKGKSIFNGLSWMYPFNELQFCEFSSRQSYLDDLLTNLNKAIFQCEPTEPDIQFTITEYSVEERQLFIMLSTRLFENSNGVCYDEGIGIKIIISNVDLAKFIDQLHSEIYNFEELHKDLGK